MNGIEYLLDTDAIIAATAIAYNLELLTLDKDLSSKL